VWPYVLEGDNLAAVKARSVDQITLRAEFAAVVEERRRRAALYVHLVAAELDDKAGGRRAADKRTYESMRRRERQAYFCPRACRSYI
jgi:hypothetical protein